MAKKHYVTAILCLLVAGCASMSKSCSQMSAGAFGTDWIVVQYAQDGHPFNCWKLHNAVVDHTEGGNVDWKDPQTGHLVGITGWENRVQVQHGDFEGAARLLGIDGSKCANGAYRP